MTKQKRSDETSRLKRAVEELSILNDLARAIGGSLNSLEIMQAIIKRSIKAIGASQGVITLVDEDDDSSMETLVRTTVSSGEQEAFHMNQSLLGWMYLNKKPVVVSDPSHDERFSGVMWDASVRNLLCVPMIAKSKLIGVLTIYNKREATSFTEDDERLLAIIAAQSAQVVENARLYEEERQLQKMQDELRLASRIQSDLLPNAIPQINGYDVAATTISAQQVGGDYFDFIPLDQHRWAFCLGDVSGKGLPASLLMANLQATLRGQALLSTSPKECVRRSNRLLHMSTGAEKFATLFYGVLDVSVHRLGIVNAGHNSPLLLTRDTITQKLDTGGVPLGILDDFAYEESEISLEPGCTLVVYSDGVTEAWNHEDEQFGLARLQKVVEENHDAPAAGLVDAIIASVRSHTGKTPQADDITIMVVKRLPS